MGGPEFLRDIRGPGGSVSSLDMIPGAGLVDILGDWPDIQATQFGAQYPPSRQSVAFTGCSFCSMAPSLPGFGRLFIWPCKQVSWVSFQGSYGV